MSFSRRDRCQNVRLEKTHSNEGSNLANGRSARTLRTDLCLQKYGFSLFLLIINISNEVFWGAIDAKMCAIKRRVRIKGQTRGTDVPRVLHELICVLLKITFFFILPNY